jgi:tRNA G26 N,N-dimethylase Trm1
MEDEKSLVAKWLMKVNNCQFTQLNWTPIHLNKVHNQDIIEESITSVKDFVYEKFQYKILKDVHSYLQVLEGEIDVLGLEVDSNSIINFYCIIVSVK